MEEISRGQGRTVLFVRHNMGVISALTQRALFLKTGEIQAVGPSREVISRYLSEGVGSQKTEWKTELLDDHALQVIAVALISPSRGGEIEADEALVLHMENVVGKKVSQVLV